MLDYIYFFLKILIFPIINFLWPCTIIGKKNIPINGQYIVTANHSSYLDFIILYTNFPKRLTFLAAEKFFKNLLWFPLVFLTGQIKVNRSNKNKTDVYLKVDKLVHKGGLLAIFPEGTRSRSGNIQGGFNGAVYFSKKYGLPILPIGIIGTFKLWPPQKKIPKFGNISLVVGKSYYCVGEDLEIETRALMKKLRILTESYR